MTDATCDYVRLYAARRIPALDQAYAWTPAAPGALRTAKSRLTERSGLRTTTERDELREWKNAPADFCYDIAGTDAAELTLQHWCDVANEHPDALCARIDLCAPKSATPDDAWTLRQDLANFRTSHRIEDQLGRKTVYYGRRGHNGSGVSWCIYPKNDGTTRWEARFSYPFAAQLWANPTPENWRAAYDGSLRWRTPQPWWTDTPRPAFLAPHSTRRIVDRLLHELSHYTALDPTLADTLAALTRSARTNRRHARNLANYHNHERSDQNTP